MFRKLLPVLFTFLSLNSAGQEKSLGVLLDDSSLIHASVSLSIIEAGSGNPVFQFNPEKNLIPASILKLFTSASALELLGPDHKFKTTLAFSGNLDKKTGMLNGDIIIKGGGDPALGSKYFRDHYGDFLKSWITELKKAGIKSVNGMVLADDSYFDYQPVPSKWLWEDPGNYYGAGVYGLSVFDNTREIHFRTSEEGTLPEITKIVPAEGPGKIVNLLVASGNSDKGYVFAAPYNDYSWIAGSIPVNRQDFILKASLTDPPHLLATILKIKLDSAGIKISGEPSSMRLEKQNLVREITVITETESPPLDEIIQVMNHESVNLFAEAIIKEIGKVFGGNGSVSSGINTIQQFLGESGVDQDGLFMEDGSGLSPLDAINSGGMANLLWYMKNKGKHSDEFLKSLPEAGKEGTLKTAFRDPVFDSRLRAKSGSMTRVRSYAGYFRTLSGNDLIFCIIINNYSGSSQNIITGIESIIKETILNR